VNVKYLQTRAFQDDANDWRSQL